MSAGLRAFRANGHSVLFSRFPIRISLWSRAMIARVRVAALSLVVAAVGTWSVRGSAAEKGAGSNASRKVKAAEAALAAFQNEEPPAPGIGPKAAASTRTDDLLKQEQELRTVRAELLTKQVLRTIEGVRRQSS